MLYLNECRAAKSAADSALETASEGSKKNEGAVNSARSEVAEAQVIADNAQAAFETADKAEREKDDEYRELLNSVAQLQAMQKNESKHAADCQKALSSAAKELTKASSDYSSASEAVASQERLISENSKYDTDAQRDKLNSLKQKQAAAKAKFDAAQKANSEADEQAKAADQARSRADIDYTEANAKLSRCKAELDELKARSQEASMKAAEAKAKFTAVTSGYEQSQGAAKTFAEDISLRRQEVLAAEKELLNAETDAASKKEKSAVLKKKLDEVKAVLDEKRAAADKSERECESFRQVFVKVNSEYEDAEREWESADSLYDYLNNDLELLEKQLETDKRLSRDADNVAADSEAEAERLRLSVRTINTKYETANIHYIQQGVGEDIILIHSIGQSLYTFRELITWLSGSFRVTALDLVGFGYSDKPYYFDYTMDEMADFIDRFMSELGINTANFFGFSMGAGYVINFAKRYPERVERLVLMCPGGITPDMPLSVRMLQSGLFGGIASKLYNLKSVEKMLNECFFDLTNLTDDLLVEYYRPASTPDCRRVVRACIANYDDEGILNSLRDVGAETLLLWGNEDKWHPTEMSDIFRNVLPNVTYNLVRNAGHLAHEEKAEKVAHLIKTFIPCGFEE